MWTQWQVKSAQAISDAIVNPTLQDNFVHALMKDCPSAKEPIAREGSETLKRMAKNAFQTLPVPAKNLLLGLTDLETKLSKCTLLSNQKAAHEQFDVFQVSVDRCMTVARYAQEKNLDVFREFEERFLIEWTSHTTDEEVANLAFAVTKVLKSLDAFVEETFQDETLEMQAEMRNPEDGLEDDIEDADSKNDSKNLHRLQKRSANLLTHAREVFEFIKRRMMARDALNHDEAEYTSQQQNARTAAQARFGLHELWDHRAKGQLQPQTGSVEQWTTLLEKAQAREDLLTSKLRTEAESVRTGPSVVGSEKFRQIQDKLSLAESVSKDLRQKQTRTRIQVAMTQRKQQDQRWALLKNKLPEMPTLEQFQKVPLADEEMNRLKKAKQLMIQELSQLQKTFHFKMSDVDIIFQSVQSGIAISEETSQQELVRARRVECEKILRQVTDWHARMQAILV